MRTPNHLWTAQIQGTELLFNWSFRPFLPRQKRLFQTHWPKAAGNNRDDFRRLQKQWIFRSLADLVEESDSIFSWRLNIAARMATFHRLTSGTRLWSFFFKELFSPWSKTTPRLYNLLALKLQLLFKSTPTPRVSSGSFLSVPSPFGRITTKTRTNKEVLRKATL